MIILKCQQIMQSLEAHAQQQTSFELLGACVRYYTDEIDLMNWMNQYFAGYFETSEKNLDDIKVYNVNDPKLFNYINTNLPFHKPHSPREGGYTTIQLDTEVDLIYEELLGKHGRGCAYYTLFKQDKKILVITSSDIPSRYMIGMRIIRAIINYLLIARGWIPFHGACCALNGVGVSIVSDKFGGKTSTLVNIVSQLRANLISNDKIMLSDYNNKLYVCALPHKMGIRIGTILAYPSLRQWVEQASNTVYPNPDIKQNLKLVAKMTPNSRQFFTEKFFITPQELAIWSNVSLVPSIESKVFLIPVFNTQLKQSKLIQQPKENISARLTSYYLDLSRQGQQFLQNMFNLDDTILGTQLKTLVAKHLGNIDLYELHQNETTNKHSANLIKELTTSITRSGSSRL